MKPGRDLDALVAEKVMGMKVWKHDGSCGCRMADNDYLPNFSNDIAAAWEVVEKMRNPKTAVSLATIWDHADGGKFKWVAKIEFFGSDRFEFALADSAPHAICLAALKAVGHF